MSNDFAFDTKPTKPLKLKGQPKKGKRLSGRLKSLIYGIGFTVLIVVVYAFFTVGKSRPSEDPTNQKNGTTGPATIGSASPPDMSSASNGVPRQDPLSEGLDTQGAGGNGAPAPANNPNAQPIGPLAVDMPVPGQNPGGKSPKGAPAPAGAAAPSPVGGDARDVPEIAGGVADPNQPQMSPAQRRVYTAAEQLRNRKEASAEIDWNRGNGDGNNPPDQAAPGVPRVPAAAGLAGQQAPAPAPVAANEPDDQNKQKRKEQFLRNAENASTSGYLQNIRRSQISEYELKNGDVIPATISARVNSDLPGTLRAKVRSNVWDHRSGRHLLIPQGANLIGTYDSQIAFGQERILCVWNEIKFPDGSTLNLQGMPCADGDGSAGLSAEVDNHWGKVIGAAAAMTTISAAAQLSQPPAVTTNGTAGAPTVSQTMAASLGQQLGQTGSAVISRNMNVQPTLKAKVGTRVLVSVTKDIVFPGPWRGNNSH